MHRVPSILIFAVLATLALAAPTPKNSLAKRLGSFKVPVLGRKGNQRDPLSEMKHAFEKHGWPFTLPMTTDDTTAKDDDIIIIVPESSSSSSSNSDGSWPWGWGWGSGESTTTLVYSTTAAPTTQAPTSTPASTKPSTGDQASTTTAPMGSGGSGDSSGSSTATGETGEVTATPEENESEYLAPVSIGGQTLTLDFDTGSADLWVFSTGLPSDESSGHTLFNPSKSSTWQNYNGGSWQISYGDGSTASGTVGFDTVTIGGVPATHQAVELADQVSSSFIGDTNNDGLVGLAFSSINTIQPEQQKTYFENVMSSLDQPLFTADLEDNASGTYEFGTIDSSKYSGDIHYTSIDNSDGFWQFDSTTYSIGGQSSTNSGASPAIADTGTSLILVDDAVAEAYYNQVSGSSISNDAGGYIYACGTSLPDFAVQIGDSGFMATVKGSDMTFAQVGDGSCFGGVQGNGGNGMQVFGDMLLKQYFAVFDGGNTKFGLASRP